MRGHALETQQNTMGTLPDTMMVTVFMQSTEYVLGALVQFAGNGFAF